MIRKMRDIYSRFIKVRLSNQIIFVIAMICLIQIIGTFFMYIYFYNVRKEEVIENNMQMLHQANSNYFSGIVEELSAASRDVFVDEVFWENGGQDSGTEDNQIYNILASQYHTGNNIDSIYLFSSTSDKLYIMDEASFNEIPVATTQSSTLYLLDDQELRLMPWFMNAKKNGGSLTVTKDRAIRDDTRDIICFSRYIKYPLKNDDYYFIISVNLNKSRLDDLHRQVDSEGESLLIFDDGLQQIYASGEGNEEDYQAVRKEIGRREETSYWFTREIGGETCIVIGDNSATEGWTMVKIIPESQALSSVQVQFISTCVIIFAMFIFGGLALYYIINRTARPIENLARTMRHYRQGERYENMLPKGRNDEVATLYRSFEQMNERINRLIESEYQSQIQEKQARLEALQAQLDPHFLYNTLQTISGIAIEKGVPEIEMIDNSLSRILRYNLNNGKTIVTVEEEMGIVRDYIEIQKFRFGERISLKVKLSKGTMESKVPVFALQLAVENAIKHGMETTVENVEICVSDCISEQTREFIISDNGRGIDEDRLREVRKMLEDSHEMKQKGYSQKGLANLNERIRQYFGSGYGVQIERGRERGTVVRIILPKGADGNDKSTDS